MRPDRGQRPTALGRADMEAFLHRLAFLESAGTDQRRRPDPGLPRGPRGAHPDPGDRADPARRASPPGSARTSPSASATSPPSPNRPNRAATCRRRSCGSSAPTWTQLTSPEMRTAVELAIDTGRRPEEICDLAFDCLARDDDGLPVLVYDNHKANRPGRRLPISEHTAARHHRPAAAGPRPLPAHAGRRAEAAAHRPAQPRRPPRDHRRSASRSRHRAWVDRMPALRTADGAEFDKSQDRALRLPAQLRPTPRRRRCPRRRARAN